MPAPLTLEILPDTLAIHRLDPAAPLPANLFQEDFVALVKTPEELSIVVRAAIALPAQQVAPGWRGFVVQGPLDFGLTGILAGLSTVLAAAEISLFAISTYDTDYVLVPEASFEAAKAALQRAGYGISTPALAPGEGSGLP